MKDYVPKKEKDDEPPLFTKTRIIVTLLLAVLIGAFAFISRQQLKKAAVGPSMPFVSEPQAISEENLKQIIETAYHPPAELFGFTGTIQAIGNNVVLLEVNDPAANPSPLEPAKKKTIQVVVAPDTKIVMIDRSQFMEGGSFPEIPISIKQLRPGRVITVTAEENILNKERFKAATIQVNK